MSLPEPLPRRHPYYTHHTHSAPAAVAGGCVEPVLVARSSRSTPSGGIGSTDHAFRACSPYATTVSVCTHISGCVRLGVTPSRCSSPGGPHIGLLAGGPLDMAYLSVCIVRASVAKPALPLSDRSGPESVRDRPRNSHRKSVPYEAEGIVRTADGCSALCEPVMHDHTPSHRARLSPDHPYPTVWS